MPAPDFWKERWQLGQTGFHRDEVHPDLLDFEDVFLDGEGLRVLVPLCGKTRDLAWLASRGHRPIGVEVSDIACRAVFDEAGIAVEEADGVWTGGGITVLQRDIFTLDIEPVDRIWDRAALVAFEPAKRGAYAAVLRRLLKPGGTLLQNHFAFDEGAWPGPPFPVTEDEVRTHYDRDGNTLERLRHGDQLDDRWRERGLTFWHASTWKITTPG